MKMRELGIGEILEVYRESVKAANCFITNEGISYPTQDEATLLWTAKEEITGLTATDQHLDVAINNLKDQIRDRWFQNYLIAALHKVNK